MPNPPNPFEDDVALSDADIDMQNAGVKKKAPKAKPVRAVIAPGGKKVQQEEVNEYAQRRRAAANAVGGSGDEAAETRAAALAAEEAAAHEEQGHKDCAADAAVDTSLDHEDDEMEELEEDEQVGGRMGAIEVWLTAIRYTAALHATVLNPFDKAAIRVHASKCKGEFGQ